MGPADGAILALADGVILAPADGVILAPADGVALHLYLCTYIYIYISKYIFFVFLLLKETIGMNVVFVAVSLRCNWSVSNRFNMHICLNDDFWKKFCKQIL